MPYFFCRLVPPRPTFPFDMTGAERELMGQHGRHLQTLIDRGQLVVAGPVADPAGPWGMAVIEAADEAEVIALTNADPVIQAGAGFSYQLFPMLSAILGRPTP